MVIMLTPYQKKITEIFDKYRSRRGRKENTRPAGSSGRAAQKSRKTNLFAVLCENSLRPFCETAFCNFEKKVAKKPGKILPVVFYILFLLIYPLLIQAETNPLYNTGREEFKQKHFDSAIQTFSAIIIEFPGNKEALYNRGLSYYRRGNYTNAIRDFERCLKIDTDFRDAAMMKAMCFQSSGQLEKARQELHAINTKYGNYDDLSKQINYNRVCMLISKNWYYILAILLLALILIAFAVNSVFVRKS
jgi:TolA-binding protein